MENDPLDAAVHAHQLLPPRLSHRTGKKVVTAVPCGSDSYLTGLHSEFLREILSCTVYEVSPEVTLSIHTFGVALQEQGEMGQPEW